MNHPTSTRIHCFLMPATWAVSCGARMQGRNGWGHCARSRNAQLSPIDHFPEIHHMSQPSKLFEPFKLGPITLPNRFAMAPLPRNRAGPPGMVPSPLAVEYYGQRASAGLLITEASQVSHHGQCYQDKPG